jgi:hypothetical protein
VSYGSWGKDNWSDGMYFHNNIFYADEGATLRIVERKKRNPDGRFEVVPGTGKSKNNEFNGNVYFGNVKYVPEDPNGIFEDPKLIHPGSYNIMDYHLQESSPCIDAGKTIVDKINDYFGRPIVNVPDIGAVEYSGK